MRDAPQRMYRSESGMNDLCSGWKHFCGHSDDRIRKIVADVGEHVRIAETRGVVREHEA